MDRDEMRRQVENRRRAVMARRVIDEAVSAVQQGRHCGTDEAFTELWEAAGRDETDLRELAHRLEQVRDASWISTGSQRPADDG